MAEVSRFHTITGAPDLLEAEVHTSLCAKVGMPPTKRPRPFGLGVAHAFNIDQFSYFQDSDLERRVIAQFGSEALFEHMESKHSPLVGRGVRAGGCVRLVVSRGFR